MYLLYASINMLNCNLKIWLNSNKYPSAQCSNCRGVRGVEPPTSSCRPPYLWPKFDPGGVEFQPPYLSFAEVGMLLDSHFLLMQFLKYLQCDDLNVTTILIHTEDWGCPLPDCP